MSGSEDEEAEEELETDGGALVERVVITLRYYSTHRPKTRCLVRKIITQITQI